MTKNIGIIGGMGPLATVKLFEKIVVNTKAMKDQDHPRIFIDNNTKIPDRTSAILGQGDSPLNELIKSAKLLEKTGADFLVMPCNTAHFYYDDIINHIDIPFINMPYETIRYISNKYPEKKVGLLATTGTLKTGIYDAEAKKLDIELAKPEKEQQEVVMSFIYDIKKGDYNSSVVDFLEVMEAMKGHGVEVFIFGCTELSVSIDIHNLNEAYICIDPMDVLSDLAIVESGCIKLND